MKASCCVHSQTEARYVDCMLALRPPIHLSWRSAAALDDAFCHNQDADGYFSLLSYPGGQCDLELHRSAGRSDRTRIVYSEERALTTTVDNIEHIESTSYDSFGVIKFSFSRARILRPRAQLTRGSQTILRQLPPGTTPATIIQYKRVHRFPFCIRN